MIHRVEMCCLFLGQLLQLCTVQLHFKNLNSLTVFKNGNVSQKSVDAQYLKQDWLYHLGSLIQKENAATPCSKTITNFMTVTTEPESKCGPVYTDLMCSSPNLAQEGSSPWKIQRRWPQACVPQIAPAAKTQLPLQMEPAAQSSQAPFVSFSSCNEVKRQSIFITALAQLVFFLSPDFTVHIYHLIGTSVCALVQRI